MHIELDDLSRPAVRELLGRHLAEMQATSPPESVHALDLTALAEPDVTFWSVWDGEMLLGCGALKELAADEGEIKSMRTRTIKPAERGWPPSCWIISSRGAATRIPTPQPRDRKPDLLRTGTALL